jgi:hypothetical protein
VVWQKIVTISKNCHFCTVALLTFYNKEKKRRKYHILKCQHWTVMLLLTHTIIFTYFNEIFVQKWQFLEIVTIFCHTTSLIPIFILWRSVRKSTIFWAWKNYAAGRQYPFNISNITINIKKKHFTFHYNWGAFVLFPLEWYNTNFQM